MVFVGFWLYIDFRELGSREIGESNDIGKGVGSLGYFGK